MTVRSARAPVTLSRIIPREEQNATVTQLTARSAETTPIAILLSEAIAFCVPADSALRDGADLLRRLGRSRESREAYGRAIELAGNTAETAYLTRRRDQLR